MKSVLISIQPKWCELIAIGKKTVEVRKTRPKIETPFKCYIYETKTKDYYSVFHDKTMGKVIGEFICNDIKRIHCLSIEKEALCSIADGNGDSEYYENSCVSYKVAYEYLRNAKKAYGWHISDLVIYDKPKELSDFHRHDNTYDNAFGYVFVDRNKQIPLSRPPQSWCYVEEYELYENIEKDYSASQKKIAEVFKNHIQPFIKEMMESQ